MNRMKLVRGSNEKVSEKEFIVGVFMAQVSD